MESDLRAKGLPETLELDGEQFFLIQGRRNRTGIYRRSDGQAFARWGDTNEIRRELALHNEVAEAGFPVAELIRTGHASDDNAYFVEASLGDQRFADLFHGQQMPSDALFASFVSLAQDFAQAQVHTHRAADWNQVFRSTEVAQACNELPAHADAIQAAWEEAQRKLAECPFVLTHGDFNPHNLFPRGVIDFEDRFYAPVGYDLVTAVTHTTWFPRSGDYERTRWYTFSLAQAERLLAAVNPAIGYDIRTAFGSLLFLRGCWSVVRMAPEWKLQAWRYTRFQTLLEMYHHSELTLESWWKLDEAA